MDLPRNRFKLGLNSGVTQIGLWLGIPDNTVAELVASAGFDWLLIDHEHGPFELRTVMSHLQVMAGYEVAPVVRPASDDPSLLKKFLDIGAQSLLLPMVEDAGQAQRIVQAGYYPPLGRRGVGTSLARAARWNQCPDYLRKANDELCLIVQVETARALDNLADIAAVEGVDGVFIGPSDLSASMGHIGNPEHPEVVEAISRAIETIRGAARHAGLLCLEPERVEQYVGLGASFIGVGVDTLLLSKGARDLVRHYRGRA